MEKFLRTGMIVLIVVLVAGVFAACGDKTPDGAEVCRACDGNKTCSVCDGDGMLEFNGNALLGGDKKCNFCQYDPGVCRTCDGEGYVYTDH